MTMPEEINRIVTDSICDHFFTTTPQAGAKLKQNGARDEQIHFVGNTMIDTLYHNLDRLSMPEVWRQHGLAAGEYLLLTLHRPANVDDAAKLTSFLDAVLAGDGKTKVVFPIHPRTRKTLDSAGYQDPRLIQTEPMGYLEFIYLLKNARAVVTDSGGITEEATVLGIPCMTLRDTTERPETVELGTNELVGTDPKNLAPYLKKLAEGRWKAGTIPDLWDGGAAVRIVETLLGLGTPETGAAADRPALAETT
jgi:UDP-N-acetylglucosamine 2-epimerase (non-hydrolysing)